MATVEPATTGTPRRVQVVGPLVQVGTMDAGVRDDENLRPPWSVTPVGHPGADTKRHHSPRSVRMSLTRVHTLSTPLDGSATGEPQSADAPFGHAGERLHKWMFATRFWDA